MREGQGILPRYERIKKMKIVIENNDDALELAEETARIGKEYEWHDMSQKEIEALAEFVANVGYEGDLRQFTDNYLINGDRVYNPTEEQKDESLFCCEDEDGETVAIMQF